LFQSKWTYIIFFTSILLNLLAVSLVANNKPADNFSIDFRLVNGLIILEASVDSKKGNFILDTGCSFVALNEEHQEGDIVIKSSDFDVLGSSTEIQEFAFGNITHENFEVVQFDMTTIEQSIGMVIDGVIGTEVTAGYNVMIDYELLKISFISDRSKLNLLDFAKYSVSKTKMFNHLNQSFVVIEIGAESFTMLLDSGANITVLDKKFKQQLESIQYLNTDIKDDNNFTLKEVRFASASINKLAVKYDDLSKFQDEFAFDGIISLSAINASKMLLDYDKEQMYFFWDINYIASIK